MPLAADVFEEGELVVEADFVEGAGAGGFLDEELFSLGLYRELTLGQQLWIDGGVEGSIVLSLINYAKSSLSQHFFLDDLQYLYPLDDLLGFFPFPLLFTLFLDSITHCSVNLFTMLLFGGVHDRVSALEVLYQPRLVAYHLHSLIYHLYAATAQVVVLRRLFAHKPFHFELLPQMSQNHEASLKLVRFDFRRIGDEV